MRLFRLLLLALLVVMLPVRGVMAAAMLCPPNVGAAAAMGQASHAHDGAEGHAQGHTQGHAHLHGAGHPMADEGAPSAPQDGTADPDTCHLCSACCSVPPVPSAAPVLPLPLGSVSTRFPALAAPAPTFQSEGPERPPRSI